MVLRRGMPIDTVCIDGRCEPVPGSSICGRPCGYGIHRTLTKLGEDCVVVAPSMIPRKSGDRQKNDKRDAASLAVLHRGGLLTAVWVPDTADEAMRDLIRARLAAVRAVRTARQQLSAFLLRHERSYRDGGKAWTKAHR